jgi:hypothetical protein
VGTILRMTMPVTGLILSAVVCPVLLYRLFDRTRMSQRLQSVMGIVVIATDQQRRMEFMGREVENIWNPANNFMEWHTFIYVANKYVVMSIERGFCCQQTTQSR